MHHRLRVAVVSLRRNYTVQYIQSAQLEPHILVLQDTGAGAVIPPSNDPLILDTVGFPVFILANVLADLACRLHPTIAIVSPTDIASQRLLGWCPAVSTIVSQSLQAQHFAVYVRNIGQVPAPAPLCVAFQPPQTFVPEAKILEVLAVLGYPATSLKEALELTNYPQRTFYRRLGAIRSIFGLAGQYQFSELGTALMAALDHPTLPHKS